MCKDLWSLRAQGSEGSQDMERCSLYNQGSDPTTKHLLPGVQVTIGKLLEK